MTTQIPDSIDLEGEALHVALIVTESPFVPHEHGLSATAWHSACWRGFVAAFAVKNGELRLRRLSIKAKEPKPLFGVQPTVDKDIALYEGLDAPLEFTGTVRVCPEVGIVAWSHKPPPGTRELTFEKGRLVTVKHLG